MKRQICLIMAAIMFLGTMITFAQKAQKTFSGTISYTFSAKDNNDPDLAAQLASQKIDITILGNCTKSVVNASGVNVISISDGNNKSQNTIIDIPGIGKYFVEQDAKTIQSKFDKVKIEYNYTDESKTIAGYNCKRCNVTITDLETNEESTSVIWSTTDLPTNDDINFCTYPGLKGYLMEAEITQELGDGNKITIVQTATAVTSSKKIKAADFTPSDAKPLSEAPEEIKNALQPLLGL